MRKIFYFLLIISSIVQAQKYNTEFFYKVINDSTKELIKIKEYNKKDVLIKEIHFNPYENIYRKTYEYFKDGEIKKNIIYYDSLKQIGVKNVYRKGKNNVTYQKTYNIRNGKLDEKHKFTITKLFDENGNNIQTNTESENSKGVVFDIYNEANQVIKRTVTYSNDTISIIDYEYYESGQLKNEKLKLTTFNSITTQYFTYNNSKMDRRIILLNSDTIKTEDYNYKGEVLKSIDVNDIKNNERYSIEVECK